MPAAAAIWRSETPSMPCIAKSRSATSTIRSALADGSVLTALVTPSAAATGSPRRGAAWRERFRRSTLKCTISSSISLGDDIAGTERGGDVRPDRTEGVADADARDGDEPTIAAGEAGAQPEVAEHEVQDAGVEVRRIRRGRLDEVDLLEARRCRPRAVPPGRRRRGRRWCGRGTAGTGSPRSSWRRCHCDRTDISSCEARGQPQYTAKCSVSSFSCSTVRSPLARAAYTWASMAGTSTAALRHTMVTMRRSRTLRPGSAPDAAERLVLARVALERGARLRRLGHHHGRTGPSDHGGPLRGSAGPPCVRVLRLQRRVAANRSGRCASARMPTSLARSVPATSRQAVEVEAAPADDVGSVAATTSAGEDLGD